LKRALYVLKASDRHIVAAGAAFGYDLLFVQQKPSFPGYQRRMTLLREQCSICRVTPAQFAP